MPSILDDVRASCRWVAARARSVRIEADRIPAYAAALSREGLPEPTYDTEHHYRGDPEATAAFVLALDAVNFGSGWFPLLRKRPGTSGYFTVATSLKERFERHGPLTAADLAAVTPGDCAALFGQMDAPPEIADLMALFAESLRHLGSWVTDRHGGRFLAAVAAADGSAERLVALLAEMPAFRDVATYDGRAVPFFKRAQLAAADLHLAFAGQAPAAFVDLDRLTLFADNLVPHVLRRDGVLAYAPAFLARIERGDPIPAGSPDEVELRACALDAVERLVAAFAAAGRPTTAHRLDYLLWNRGQGTAYKAHPRHRTRSRYY